MESFISKIIGDTDQSVELSAEIKFYWRLCHVS